MRLQPDKKLHSREHLLADDLARGLGELKKFPAYLGIAQRFHESDLRSLLSRVLQKADLPVDARGKYFFAALRGFIKKPFRPAKKKKRKPKKMQRNYPMPQQLPIIQLPHKVLRKKASEIPVREIRSREIQELIMRMKETLSRTANGVGLAGPQVNKSLRIFIVSEEAEYIDKLNKKDLTHEESVAPRPLPEAPHKWKYYVFINPIIRNSSKKRLEDAEGCLSVRDKFGSVRRAEKVSIEALDENGKKFMRGYSKFFARVVQHEYDHLEGVLFVDRAEVFITPS